MAVYLAGIMLRRGDFIHRKSVMRFHDGLAWLMQITMFLTLGLLVFPSRLPPIMGVGLLHRYGEIALCYVHPYYQGYGIGKGLLEDMERKARALKIKTLLLKSSLNAVSFYQLHGYVNDGPREMFLGEIRFQPMRKVLAARLRLRPPSSRISGENA